MQCFGWSAACLATFVKKSTALPVTLGKVELPATNKAQSALRLLLPAAELETSPSPEARSVCVQAREIGNVCQAKGLAIQKGIVQQFACHVQAGSSGSDGGDRSLRPCKRFCTRACQAAYHPRKVQHAWASAFRVSMFALCLSVGASQYGRDCWDCRVRFHQPMT